MKTFLRVVGFGTRLCSFLIGLALAAISVPVAVLAAAVPQGEPLLPGWELIAFVISGAVAVCSGFIMFGVGWPARMANLRYRGVTFLLLLVPLVAGVALMFVSNVQFPPKNLATALIVFTGWLLLLCLKPGLLHAADQHHGR